MKFTETKLKGCFIIEPNIFGDQRGYFYESYNKKVFDEGVGHKVDFVQDNQSYSKYGTLRGLHFQKGIHAQAKLVRVLEGEVLDVAVDLRKESATYGEHISIKLSSENKNQLFVPRGFAHGFIVLSEVAMFSYKCDNYYNKESEGGIIYNDTSLNIDWILDEKEFLLSDKDKQLEPFQEGLTY